MADRRLPRRAFLVAGAAGAGLTVGGVVVATTRGDPVPLPAAVAGLPRGQHAWNDVLRTDAAGNPVPPRFNRLLLFDVAGDPGDAHVRHLEAVLRRLEHTFPWRVGGLLHTLGWAPAYFAHHTGADSPVPDAKPLAVNENPQLGGLTQFQLRRTQS